MSDSQADEFNVTSLNSDEDACLAADVQNPMIQNKPPSRLRQAIYLVLFLVVMFYVGKSLAGPLGQLNWQQIDIDPWYLVLAFVSFLISRVLFILPCRSLLACFCKPPGWLAVTAISWLPQLGKYLPGKVLGLAGMAYMLRRHGIAASVGVTVGLLLSALSILVGLMVSAPLLMRAEVVQVMSLGYLWGGIILLLGLACLHPRVIGGSANFVLRKLGKPSIIVPPRLRDYIMPVVNYALQWFLWGLTFYFMACAIMPVPLKLLPLIVSASALSGTLGVLAVFAPAGLGVRELVLLQVLTPAMGQEVLGIAIIGTRIIQTLCEFGLGAVGFGILRLNRIEETHT